MMAYSWMMCCNLILLDIILAENIRNFHSRFTSINQEPFLQQKLIKHFKLIYFHHVLTFRPLLSLVKKEYLHVLFH